MIVITVLNQVTLEYKSILKICIKHKSIKTKNNLNCINITLKFN